MRRIEAWVFAEDDPRRLAAVRIGLFGLLAYRLATNGDYQKVAGQPEELFDPVSLFHLLPSMPSSTVTTIAQIAGVLAALCAAGGVAPRISFPSAFAISVFLNLMLNATGKIVHNDLVLTLALIPLLAAPTAASRAWSATRDQHPPRSAAYGWPIRAAMIVVALAYLFAGLQKLRYTGIDWATGDNLRNVLLAASDGQSSPNDLGLFIADHSLLFHLFAAGTFVVEIGFILCLPFERLRWFFVPAAFGLHFGIWLTMDLDYFPQALTAVIVFVNWPRITQTNRHWRAVRKRISGSGAATS